MRYRELVEVYLALEQESRRLAKTQLLADFLRTHFSDAGTDEELGATLLLLQGRVFPPWDKRTLGVSSKLAVKAVSAASGASERRVNDLWKELGDLGRVAVELAGTNRQATLIEQELGVMELFHTLQKLPAVEGPGSVGMKVKLLSALLTSATGEEARFVIRTVLETLRVGIAEGTLRDAIAWAYLLEGYGVELSVTDDGKGLSTVFHHDKEKIIINIENNSVEFHKTPEFVEWITTSLRIGKPASEIGAMDIKKAVESEVQRAYDRANDFGIVAAAARSGGVEALREISLELGKPVRVMLAQRETSVADAIERLKPCAFEYKYDGFRMQIHKSGDEVTIFTRRLENVTVQFPEVVEAVRAHIVGDAILDCEAVGYDPKTGAYRAFQHISQRIRRKYEIAKLAEELPVEVNVFDVLYDGDELLDRPFRERRERLRKLLPTDAPRRLRLSEEREIADTAAGERFYKESLAAGNEGVMVKSLDGRYQPGSRVGHMVKVKPVMDTMDLVIVAAEWGEGKRSGWLTSFTLACIDGGELKPIGRVGTGLKELEQEGGVTFAALTERLQPLILRESGREVDIDPAVVIEVAFEEIQQSPSYSSGYALRFPRLLHIREDRGPEEATALDEVRLAYEHQRGR